MRYACLAILLLACGTRSPRPPAERGVPWARSGVDWRTPPVPSEMAWTAPTITETTLANGIRIVVVENHRLPLVALRALHTAAGSRMDGSSPGLAALTADLLAEGAGRNAMRVETAITTDHAAQLLVTRTRDLGAAITRLADIVRRPTFDDHDFARVRSTRLAETLEHRTQTRRIAARVFDRVVFGAHPYAVPAEGTVTSVAALTPAMVRAFWARAYRPDATTLVVAGDTTLAEVHELVRARFADWPAPTTAQPAVQTPPPYQAAIAYVDVPGARETNVIVGARAGAVDPLAGEIANAIVGGGVDGRLDRELHARLALTFGASSSFWRGVAGSSWAAAATFDTANTATGVNALLGLLATARTTEPTADELAAARRDLVAGVRSGYEFTSGTARAVERLVLQRQPLGHTTFEARVAALTTSQVKGALPLGELSIVIVGDWSRIRDGLASLGAATPYEP